jgi:hypothetical protein
VDINVVCGLRMDKQSYSHVRSQQTRATINQSQRIIVILHLCIFLVPPIS